MATFYFNFWTHCCMHECPFEHLEVVSGLLTATTEGNGPLLERGQLLCEVVIVEVHEVREEGVGEEVFATGELQLTSGHLDEVSATNLRW